MAPTNNNAAAGIYTVPGVNDQVTRNVASNREDIIQKSTETPETNTIIPPVPTPITGVGSTATLTPQLPSQPINTTEEKKPVITPTPTTTTEVTPSINPVSEPVVQTKSTITKPVEKKVESTSTTINDPVEEAKKQIEEENKIKQQEADKVRKETIDKINAETKTEDQKVADEKGYAYKKNQDGSITFSPKDLDEAIDIYTTFGTTSKIDKSSKAAIVGSAIYENYNQYKGATADVYLQGFKTNDIGVGGKTWDQLVKMNGGQPTAEMLKAQEQWEQETKTNNVNTTIKTGAGEKLTTTTETLTTNLTTLDTAYNDFLSKSFAGLQADYTAYKAGNEKMTTLNNSLTSTAAEIDELEVAKRKVIEDTKARYPHTPMGIILGIADKQIQDIDDQLFVKQRKYNSDLSTYKFEDEKNRADFEYNTKIAEQKMSMAEKLYGIQRGDIIRKEDIDRADKLLANEIARAKEAKAEAIAQGDKDAARDQAYKIAEMELQAKLNKENKANFQGFSVTGGIMSYDSETGTAKFIPAEESSETSSTQDTTVGTYTLPNGKQITSTGGLATGLSNILSENPDIQIDYQNLYRSSTDQQKLYGKGRTAEQLLAAGVPVEYADPKSAIVTNTLDSNHMKGNAVDVVVPKGQDKVAYINSIESTMNQNGFYRPAETIKAGDYGHFEYRGNGSTGNISIPNLAFDITSVLPKDLYKTNDDMARLEKRVQEAVGELQSKGIEINSNNIANTVRGYNIKPDANQEMAKKLQLILSKNAKATERVDWGTVADFINAGDDANAEQYVSNIVEKQAKDFNGSDFISTPVMNQSLKTTNELSKLITKNKDQIGLISGTITDLKKKFEDNPDIQKLQTLLTAYQANIRKAYAGSAVTPTELSALENYIAGDIKMTPNNLITMINTINDLTKDNYIGQREQFGMKGIFQEPLPQKTTSKSNDYINSIITKKNPIIKPVVNSYLDSLNLKITQ